MANMFCVHKAERTKLRKLPFLPRLGVTVEIAGRQFVYKQVPFLETVLNIRDRGFNLRNIAAVAREELDEVRFPLLKRPLAAVKDLHQKATTKVKKAPAKAAAKKKTDDEVPSAT
jgi:hypothetical protein